MSESRKETLHILFVENDPEDIFFTDNSLTEAGYTGPLTQCKDGVDAIVYLEDVLDGRELCPDIVLMDVNMPRMNGIQTLEWIRQQERFKQLPVVLLSGATETVDPKKTKHLGVYKFLTKQVHYNALIQTLDGLVAHTNLMPQL